MDAAALADYRLSQSAGPGARPAWERFASAADSFVRDTATTSLRRFFVVGPDGGPDLSAVDDVTAATMLRLAETSPGGPRYRSRFKETRGRGGVAGLHAWLAGLTRRATVDYCRTYRNARRRIKLLAAADLDPNPLPDEGPLLDRFPAQIVRPDLLPILNDCIDQLPPDLRHLVRLKLDEGLSLRQTAPRVGMSAPVVCRRLADAYAKLRNLLEDRGFDGTEWA